MAISGNKRRIYIGVSMEDVDEASILSGEQSNTLSLEAEMLETTDKSSDWRQYIPGVKGGTAEVTVFADQDDEKQASLINSLMNGTKVFCFIGTIDDDGTRLEGDAFEAFVSSISTPNEIGSVVSRNISLQITGQVSHI